MNDYISKKFVNWLIDNARINNVDLMSLYYTNSKVFDIVFTLASVKFAMLCRDAFIEVLKNERKRLKK